MAKVKGHLEGLHGEVSGLVFYQRGDKTIVYAKAEQRASHTSGQMKSRVRWSNIISTYQAFNGKLSGAFETKPKGKTDYTRFISLNLNCPIFIPQKQNDVYSIAAPYQISEGSLSTIEVEDLGNQCIKSNIRIGDLQIDNDTTLGQLTRAILSLNNDIDKNDRLCFCEVLQHENIPVHIEVKMEGFKLGDMSDVRVKDLLKAGFENVNGCLGARNLPKGCYTWIHIRKVQPNLPAKVSTQCLTNLNKEMVEAYSSDEAFAAAAQSYGCKDSEMTTTVRKKEDRSPFE